MQKKLYWLPVIPISKPELKQIIRGMKLTTILLTVAFVQVYAAGNAQTITLSGKRMSLQTFFKSVKKQTGYVVLGKKGIYYHANEISVSIVNKPLIKVLDEVMEGQPLGYIIQDKTIVLYEKQTRQSDLVVPEKMPAAPPPLSEVHGRVTDSTGTPLSGASVKIKGTTIGTATDVNGAFTINAKETEVLIISFVGYQVIELPANSSTLNAIKLFPLENKLEETVVVGYGTQRKSDLTGSISKLKGDDLAKLPTQRVDQALQGRAAGVMVLNTDGAPGGNTTIRIRGMNSIIGGNNALVVVDGLQDVNLSAINPNDVASVEILKDASATAIYGSRGANGVILITTKSGGISKPMISYSYDIGSSKLAKKIDLLNAADYALNVNADRLSHNNSGFDPVPIFSEADIQRFRQNDGTDWQDVIYSPATTQNHQLSVSGGSQKVNYSVSSGYLNQKGILKNTGYKRFTLRAIINADITNWAKFGINWYAYKDKTNSGLFGGYVDWPNNAIGAALRFSPNLPVYDSTGNYSRASTKYGNPTIWNPLASALEPVVNNETIQNNLYAYLEFQVLKGLTLRINGGAILTNTDNGTFYNTKTFTGLQNNALGMLTNLKGNYYQNSNILTYYKALNKHRFTFTGVAEQSYTMYYSTVVNASNFVNAQTGLNDLGSAKVVTNSSAKTERVMNSYLARINYAFNDRYLLTASYRADGSSVFGKNNKWGYFPSVGLAYRLSEEKFMKDLNVFSDLKLRASWGVTGNQAIQPYQSLSRMASGKNYPYNGGDAINVGAFISTASNPDLKWESTTQKNIGLDLGFFKQRLKFVIDYYDKVTKDLLMPKELPLFTGLTSVTANVGSIGNKGIEFTVEGDPIVNKKFKWHSNFNISSNSTTILDLGGTNMIGYNTGGAGQGTNAPFMFLIKGQPFGQMKGWKYLGVWQENDRSESVKYGQLPGDPHYLDKNNDGKVDIADTTVIGNALPKFIYGWSNQLSYKNFDLSIQIQGVYGNNIFNVARIGMEDYDATSARVLNRWTPQNPNSEIPGIIDDKTRDAAHLVKTIAFPVGSENTSSRWVEDASYARLKNITLAYSFSRSTLRNVFASSLKIYMSATNLITLTKYKGYDPEVSSFNVYDAMIGTDYNNYPPSRTITFGLNLTF